MKTIGFFEELQSNGMITRSSNRLMCMASLIAALMLIFVSVYFNYSTELAMIEMLKTNTIKANEMKLISSSIGMSEWLIILIGTLLTYAFGFKAYGKNQELKSTDADTPVLENTTA